MYRLLRSLLFCFEPEIAHKLALFGIEFLYRCRLSQLLFRVPSCPCKVMNLNFPNPVGLAAGLDKDAEHIAALASLGFGFIEVGTVTPRSQTGHPKPRLFRLPSEQALINHMGFNSKGLDYFLEKIRHYKGDAILGINIGKNMSTPLAQAADDYLIGLERVYPYADYITVNISSPNTASLTDLQQSRHLHKLLTLLKKHQTKLAEIQHRYVPLVVKLSPDLTDNDLIEIAEVLLSQNIDAVIVSNTTRSRHGVEHLVQAKQAGGLSGRPLFKRSTQMVAQLHQHLQQRIPIIGLGGVMTAEDAQEKFAAGAKLIQLYTGFIYRGPRLIKEIIHTYQQD